MRAYLSHQSLFDHAAAHLASQGNAALMRTGGGAYRGRAGGSCPIGALIRKQDYTTSMEGVPVRYLSAGAQFPAYMDAGVAALRRALHRARVDIQDNQTVALLSCLQNVHDVFGTWEWQDRLKSIAHQFGLRAQHQNS